MREILVVLGILLCLGTYQIYITIAKYEPWAWLGVAAITATTLLALYLDSRHER